MASAKRKRGRTRGGCTGKASERPEVRLLEGDCFEVLAKLEPESVDAIVTDPPYGIGFQHESWDSAAIREAAAQAGNDRLSPNEAFEVWCRLWAEECRRVMKPGAFLAAFGSPRTHHRLACGVEDAGLEIRDTLMWLYSEGMSKSRHYPDGRSTTLKPAFEPIVLARRDLDGTTEETIACHGTGALCAEDCKVEGRHPANVIFGHNRGCDEECCAPGCPVAAADACAQEGRSRLEPSRFLYCPKASRAERAAGCESLPPRALDLFPNAQKGGKKPAQVRNPHPTVKPLALMRWLVRLLCPPGGLVLDPTMGSGTTGAAALLEGRRFIGIELEPAYMEIATARIDHHSPEGSGALKVGSGPLGKRRRR
jgi:DNA modification methylase